jgi:Hypothetical glycosyl hydrolase family 15
MSLLRSPSRGAASARLLAFACLLLATSLGLASPAGASTAAPVARIAISGSSRAIVSGKIVFAARIVGRRVRRVVFEIDGRHVWATSSRPYRYHRTGILDTNRLSDGFHVLIVKAIYAGQRSRVARRRIDVRHPVHRPVHRPSPAPTPPPPPPVVTGPANVGVQGPPAGGFAGAPVGLFNRETYNFSTSWPMAQEGGRYQVMVLQATDAAMVPVLHQANPNLKIFLYQDPKLSRSSDPTGLSVCTDYPAIVGAHPDWFVRDAAGNPISPAGYPGNYIMDLGNPAYEQACVAHATALAKQYGFDGIFFDDFSAVLSWTFSGGVFSPEYPTDAAWQAATYAMISYAGPQVHAQGLLAIGNIGGATFTPGLWQKWNAPLDGAEEEAWAGASGTSAQSPSTWSAQLTNLAWSEANHKYAVLHSYAATETGNTFGLASMLLAANGEASYSTSNLNCTSAESWYPEYDLSLQLGAPTGASLTLSNGVDERVFAHGIVLVNPSPSATAPFSLGSNTYTGSSLTNARTTTMAPQTGLILLKTG